MVSSALGSRGLKNKEAEGRLFIISLPLLGKNSAQL